MKSSKLTTLLAVTISFELLVGPLIPMVSAATKDKKVKTEGKSSAGEKKTNASDYTNMALQAIGSAIGGFGAKNNMGSTSMGKDMGLFQQQQTPIADKSFNLQKLSQIPGLGEYLQKNNINPAKLNCTTLPTTLHKMEPEVCRVGITMDKGNPEMQSQQALAYYDGYFQVANVYKNFQETSLSGDQAFGVGCMNGAMDVMSGFFNSRVAELDKTMALMEKETDNLVKNAKKDLDAIKESLAILEGGDSEITNKLRSTRPDLFDFQKRVGGNDCDSIFDGGEVNKLGVDKGLNSIKSKMNDTLNTQSGTHSGKSYGQANAAIEKDIMAVADKMSKQLELNFTPAAQGGDKAYSDLLGTLNKRVSSSTKVASSITPDTFADLQTKFLQSNLKMNEERDAILRSSTDAGAALKLIGQTSSGNFNSAIGELENSIKNKCFQESIDLENLLDRTKDNTLSGSAKTQNSKFIKEQIEKIINSTNSIEEKVEQMRKIEAQQQNRYTMKGDKPLTVSDLDAEGNVVTSIVNAKKGETVSSYFSNVVRTCNTQFKVNKIGSAGISGGELVRKLNKLNTDFKKLAKDQAQGIRDEVRKKLIECESPEIANNSAPASCNSDLFNVTKPGFCSKAAFSCSKKMTSCNEKIEKFTESIKTQKTERVKNYQNTMEVKKAQILNIFDATMVKFAQEGDALNKALGIGFTPPLGIKRELDGKDRYVNDVKEMTAGSTDGQLNLDNPEAYLKIFKDNITALKKSITEQQNKILSGDKASGYGGFLAQEAKNTAAAYKAVVAEAADKAEKCRAVGDGYIKGKDEADKKSMAEYQKNQSDLGEKRPLICSKFGTGNTNSVPNCTGDIDDLGSTALKIAAYSTNSAEDSQSVKDWMYYCSEAQNHKAEGGSFPPMEWKTICAITDRENKDYKYAASNECKLYIHLTTGSGEDTTEITALKKNICDFESKTDPATKEISTTYKNCLPKNILKDLDENYSRDMRISSNESITISQPSFCNAGNGDNRNTTKQIIDELSKGLGGMGPAVNRN